MPRCVIIGAGPVDPEQKELFLPGDYVIACDAGYRNAAALGVAPDLIVGDFDSAPRPEAENLVVLPAEKDDTDTHYAARLVPDATLGASNETAPGGAEVRVADGSLLLVCAPK